MIKNLRTGINTKQLLNIDKELHLSLDGHEVVLALDILNLFLSS